MHQVKLFLHCDYAHCEILKSEEAYTAYLSDGHTTLAGPFEYGHAITQGYRSDFEQLVADCKAGLTEKEIYERNIGLLRYTRAVDKAIELFSPPPPMRREVDTTLLWGPNGAGKSYRLTSTKTWDQLYYNAGAYSRQYFEFYKRQPTICIDEFRSAEWPITDIARICQEPSCPEKCFYRSKFPYWRHVVICTNENPQFMYGGDMTFQRRLTRVIFVEKRLCDGGIVIPFED